MKRLSYCVVFLSVPVISLVLPGATSAWAQAAIVPPETIILISLDTTRADRMSCYGYEHETTPNIDALAKESLFFEHPFAPVPMTLPSHCSMFTGLIPPTHGVHENSKFDLPPSALTLPELLKEQGYTTYGIVSAMVLEGERGLGQGFDHYDDAIGLGDVGSARFSDEATRNGKETTARALQWLDKNAEKKKFMFIHYFDAHNNYEPPAPFDTRFEDPYDGEIAFTDFCVGQILDRLKELDLYDNALIALVGDHGEMLGEHDEPYHGFFIYQNVLRVPMMFKPAGAIPSRRIKDPSSLIDVTPTLLSMAGLEVPETMQGVDLSSYLRPGFTLPDRAIYAESMLPTAYNCSSLLGIVMGQWHYIQSTRPELYDRLKDPAEKNNLIAQYPEQASKMKDRLERVLAESENSNVDTSVELDAETLDQLAALGYSGDDVKIEYFFDEGKDDAKDLIEVQNQLYEALNMARSGKSDLAIKMCTDIIQQHPKVPKTYRSLSDFHYDRKEFDEAIGVLQRLLELFPDDRSGLINLSKNYLAGGKYANAIDTFNKLIVLKADDVIAYKGLINIHMRQGATAKALETQNRMHEVLPRTTESMITLGVIYMQRNDTPRALTSFLDALALDPKSVGARVNAASMYLKMRNPEQALLLYEEAFAQGINMPIFHRSVARIKMSPEYAQLYDPRSALSHAQIALQLSKDTKHAGKSDVPAIFETLAMAWAVNGNIDEAVSAAARAMELYRVKGLAAQTGKMANLIEYLKKQK